MTRLSALSVAIAAGLICAATAPAQNANALTSQEQARGWKLLFNGNNLDGWTPRSTVRKDNTGNWKVEKGSIVCPGTGQGWLSSDRAYANFHLKLQFRGADNLNSGVFLRSQPEGQPHQTGFELQIWDHQPAGYNTGSLVGAVKAQPTKIKANQWNDYDITADGNHYHIVLNGQTLLDADNSQHASGLIGFQCQPDNRVEFRDIRIKELK